MRKFFILLICLLLCGCERAVAADSDIEGTALPVLMYHSILKDPARTGEYVITPDSFAEDIAYLDAHGYETVTAAQVREYVQNKVPLPRKSVMLTFDDGHLNNLTYALPVMMENDIHGIISPVGAFTMQAEKENDPNPRYAYLTRNDLAALTESRCFEIGCHTYNMHSIGARRGAEKMKGESAEEYTDALRKDICRWRDMMNEYDIDSQVYAYPYGFYSEEGFDVLREQGFSVILTCRERTNMLTYSPDTELIILDRYNRNGLMSTEEFMESIGIG